MFVERLWLRDFRSHALLELELGDGVTVVTGPNGAGKTNLVEALSVVATQESFRGAPAEAVVRRGADSAVVRAAVVRGTRRHLIEMELPARGRPRTQLDNQSLKRRSDLAEALVVCVFTPDDLELVKGGPAGRRQYLDDTVSALAARHGAARAEFERSLRQRNALLRSLSGRLPDEAEATLDVWDQRCAESGTRLAWLREQLVVALSPLVSEAYVAVSSAPADIQLTIERSWGDDLAHALAAARRDDVRRGTSTVGPQRDELAVSLNGFGARHQASQGEQRCLALALRLGAHRLLADRLESTPVLLLDDVFSELDTGRAHALMHSLPAGQVIITSAAGVPAGATPDRVVELTPERPDDNGAAVT
jgi:DNA replication and repair protein RecF